MDSQSLMSSFLNAHHNDERTPQVQSQIHGSGMTKSNKDSANLYQDSLLGMAASLFNNNSINTSGNPFAQQSQPSRPEDIMDQVLSELSDDLFDTPFDLEPVPINHGFIQPRMNHQPKHNSLDLLEDSLNQVLNGLDGDFAFAPSVPTSSSVKRTLDTDLFHMMPPAKKQCVAVPPAHVSSSMAAPVEAVNAEEEDDDKNNRFRPYQAEQWSEKFEELLEFKKQRGHCCVPHTFEENPSLARWVKRQRYQYKLKNEGKPSTMTDERVVALESVGFVWDSHGAAWEERWQELSEYRQSHGHSNVPSNHPANPQLATWVKCQRRQYKLFWDGKPSNMTLERITKLEQLGFEWELRGFNKNSNKTGATPSAAAVAAPLMM